MTMHLDDPRLTAYALGELDDERERIEVELFVANSGEARELVAEIRETASTLRAELGAEPLVGLSEQHLHRIEARLNKKPRGRVMIWLGAAAAVLCGVLLTSQFRFDTAPAVEAPAPPTPTPGSPIAESLTTPPTPLNVPPPTPSASPRPAPPRTTPTTTAGEEFSVPGGVEGGVPGGIVGGVVGGMVGARAARVDPATLRQLQSLGYTRGGAGAGPGYVVGSGQDAAYSGYGPTGFYDGYLDVQRARPEFHTEAYSRFEDNPFLRVEQNPLSTFSTDVDTASFANVRRFLSQSTLPPKDAVRIEEMVNYFDYAYPAPEAGLPFSVNVEVADAPWRPEHRLVRIGLKGTPLLVNERPRLNLVFLLDVSGSMEPANKLPLLQKAMRLLVDELTENDQVAIAVYAGASGLVLPRTSGDRKQVILNALDRLRAGGSTNGGAGIQLAYDHAVAHFISGGVNRVVLATDGDFNVGVTSEGALTRLIEEKAESGVFLSVLGFGMGNYKDATLEQLADRGNGNYAYIDSLPEARKVLVREMGSTLVTIAKDVKIQIEFNPAEVESFRLIGYENRMLRSEDFNDDEKDAGEIGAGHTVTALYEIVPPDAPSGVANVDPLKYQRPQASTEAASSGELLTVKLRYKEPDGERSKLLSQPVRDDGKSYAHATEDFQFAAAVASFGMILRDSPYKGNISVDGVLELARQGMGQDRHGYRTEFLELVRKAKPLLAK